MLNAANGEIVSRAKKINAIVILRALVLRLEFTIISIVDLHVCFTKRCVKES